MGPEYGYGVTYPSLGAVGEVIRMDGCTVSYVGQDPVELVTVQFDDQEQADNVCINRLEVINEG